ALLGSSYYRLPRVLQWFSGNIGFHHIHHLSPKIPNYKLQRCHEENPLFQESTVLDLRSSLKSASMKLWDEERGRMIRFNQLKTLYTVAPAAQRSINHYWSVHSSPLCFCVCGA